MIPECKILTGDCRAMLKTLKPGSVHCCVTSPPYWNLRDYKLPPVEWPALKYSPMAGARKISVPAWSGQCGLEPTPQMFVAHMVLVFRAVKRVLRDDGTCWVNLGDTYIGSGRGGDTGRSGLQGTTMHQDESKAAKEKQNRYGPRLGSGSSFRRDRMKRQDVPHKAGSGLKCKDLAGMPWRVAMALQADGWYLRQDIIWSKPNPMPESVSDRCTKSHEYIFLLTKSRRYFYDAEAIKEKSSPDSHLRHARGRSKDHKFADGGPGNQTIRRTFDHMRGVTPKSVPKGKFVKANEQYHAAMGDLVSSRNKRSVLKVEQEDPVSQWLKLNEPEIWARYIKEEKNKESVWSVNSFGYAEAHFATFPPELIRPAIQAGTSSSGCCEECGAPLKRVIKKGKPNLAQQRACGGDANGKYEGKATKDYAGALAQNASETKARILAGMVENKTVGWERTCDFTCRRQKVEFRAAPCVVLDPFGGSGTTARVALEEGRSAILVDLNEEYIGLARQRTVLTPGFPVFASRADEAVEPAEELEPEAEPVETRDLFVTDL